MSGCWHDTNVVLGRRRPCQQVLAGRTPQAQPGMDIGVRPPRRLHIGLQRPNSLGDTEQDGPGSRGLTGEGRGFGPKAAAYEH